MALIGVDLSLQCFVGGIQPLIGDVGFFLHPLDDGKCGGFLPQGPNISALAGSVAITASAGTANRMIRVTSTPPSSLGRYADEPLSYSPAGDGEVPGSVSAGIDVVASGCGETARDRDRLLLAGGVASAALPPSARFDRDLVLRAGAASGSGSVATGISASTGMDTVADFRPRPSAFAIVERCSEYAGAVSG